MATKVPGVEVAISDINASGGDGAKVLLIGIRRSTGSVAALTLTRMLSDSQADDAWGIGSQLAQMCRYARRQAPRVEYWAIGIAEAGGGTAATKTFTFGGTATTANPVYIQIEDKTLQVPVAIGDDGDAIAASALAVLQNGDYDGLHVTGSVTDNVLTLTARSKGPHGTEISVKVLHRPPGVTAAAAAGVSGATAPDVDAALQILGGVRYHYIVLPDSDATNLADTITFLNARWEAESANDGHAFIGKRDSVSNLVTLGDGEDTKHVSIIGDPYVPTSPWAQAAAVAAARAAKTNPKASIRNTLLTAITGPLESEYLEADDRDALLQEGIACYRYVQGIPTIDRLPTLAKTNDLALSSEALYDLETKITASAIRQARIELLQSLLGKILVDDASSTEYDLATGREIIDPEGIRQRLLAQYEKDFMPQAWVDDLDEFAEDLVVEKTNGTTVTWAATDRINGILYRTEGTQQFIT